MLKKLFSFLFFILAIFYILNCGNSTSSDSLGSGQYLPAYPYQPENSNSKTDFLLGKGYDYFYFSYDDSASTASVDLVKYKLSHYQIPSTDLARPWEFYNYETFTESNMTSLGIFSVSMTLNWRTNFPKNLVNWQSNVLNENIDFYQLGVYVKGPSTNKQNRKNVVLTLVVDVSGSMEGTSNFDLEIGSESKLELLKYALKFLPNSLKEGDTINLVTFSDEGYLIAENVNFNRLQDLINTKIDKLVTIGGTNLNAGLQMGYTVADKYYNSSKSNRVILITDAYANVGEVDSNFISNYVRREGSEGILISGVGMGYDFNDSFLNVITDKGKGAYFACITKNDAKKIFQDRFISLVQVAAREVKFRLDFPKDLIHIDSGSEESSKDPNKVQATNFSYNNKQYFYETFVSNSVNSTKLSHSSLVLSVLYKDNETLDSKKESIMLEIGTVTYPKASLENINNIYDAESIFLLNQLIAKKNGYDNVAKILNLYYPTYTSPLFQEYKKYIEAFKP